LRKLDLSSIIKPILTFFYDIEDEKGDKKESKSEESSGFKKAFDNIWN